MSIIYLIILLSTSFLISANIKITGPGNVKLSSSKLKLDGNINNSSTFVQNNSSTFDLGGNWNNTGTFASGNGSVYFSSSISQTITNPQNSNFYNFFVSKQNGNVILANSNSITIDGSLNFESNTLGNIYSRDNSLVYVSSSSVTRLGQGFVDGPLAMYFESGDVPSRTFQVGNTLAYTPVEIDINETGGSAGYLMITSNDRTASMTGSQLDENLNVERQYELVDNIDQNFDLATRTFSMVIHYLNPEDLRNGANSNTFVTAKFNGSTNLWDQFLYEPTIRTQNSVNSTHSIASGTFVVGPEDYFLKMYTRSSGSFNEPSNWSLYEYGGPPSGFSPRNRDIPFIGDGDRIDLYDDIDILPNRTLTVEQAGSSGESGTFLMADNVLSGSGTFTLNSGAWLGFGSSSGLMANDNSGNIQTAVRNYNPLNHNNSSFIFTGISSSTVGDGFPQELTDFYVNGSDELFMLQNTNVNGDLNIISGILDLESFDISGSNSGIFNIEDDARLRLGSTNNLSTSLDGFAQYLIDVNSYVVFNGTEQTISLLPANFNTSLGYGNLLTTNLGTKLVDSDLIVRGSLFIEGSSVFENSVNVNRLHIYNNIVNLNSGLNNYGKIILGLNN
ncbi:hypothetical protein OAQ99_07550 [Candidatus Kapabacteria bacterium]|nr:hypothetical protein [Candidatus Kapabacteria bacterium]